MLPKDELLDIDAIRLAVIPKDDDAICGVYFLFRGPDLIYIGQSINVRSRLLEHLVKGFDGYSYIRCGRDELNDIEAAYILKFKPPMNGNMGWHQAKSIPPCNGIDLVRSAGRASVIPIDGLTRGQRTANRRDRVDYNAYQREYMRKRRAGLR